MVSVSAAFTESLISVFPHIMSTGHTIETRTQEVNCFLSIGQIAATIPLWAGKQCGLRFAMFAVIAGYRRVRIRPTAPARNAAQLSGTRAALTAGHERSESKRGVAAGRRRRRTDDEPPQRLSQRSPSATETQARCVRWRKSAT
jgi:hypothetical protein